MLCTDLPKYFKTILRQHSPLLLLYTTEGEMGEEFEDSMYWITWRDAARNHLLLMRRTFVS